MFLFLKIENQNKKPLLRKSQHFCYCNYNKNKNSIKILAQEPRINTNINSKTTNNWNS